jgi:hypothetical protein
VFRSRGICLHYTSRNLFRSRDEHHPLAFISISENCTILKELDVSSINKTDASLIDKLRIALTFYVCDGLSSDKLRYEFNSVSELRAPVHRLIWLVYQAVQLTPLSLSINLSIIHSNVLRCWYGCTATYYDSAGSFSSCCTLWLHTVSMMRVRRIPMIDYTRGLVIGHNTMS